MKYSIKLLVNASLYHSIEYMFIKYTLQKQFNIKPLKLLHDWVWSWIFM